MSQSVLEKVGEQIDKTAHETSRAASYVEDAFEDGVKAARRAAKHGGYARRQIRRARQVEQQRQGLDCDALTRHIEQPGAVFNVKVLPALRIRGRQIAQMHILKFIGVRSNRAPCAKRRIQLCHGA